MRCIVVEWGRILALVAMFLGLVKSPANADELVSALKLQAPVLLCDEKVPMDNPSVAERFEKEMLLAMDNRAQLILWLKRSTRYFPYIEKTLRQHNLPDDLKYLAVAESALRVHAGSSKGALGVWQLMPQTAEKYGLQVNDDIDERRQPYVSTSAAVAYLKDLFDQFGSWSLSLAAYNMGAERLEAELLEQGINDYYRLYLPLETQRFIFRILAIKMIFQAPETHGVNLAEEDYYLPEVFSIVTVSDVKDLPLRLIASAAHTDFKTIKDLNPELRGYYLTTNKHMLNLPVNADVGFFERLARLVENEEKLRGKRLYVVKKGDSLSGIAKKFEVPVTALLIWNRIGIHHVIHPGQRLVIFLPPDSNGPEPTPSDKES
jgi:membrane-bound lytic murein transglycosylase D